MIPERPSTTAALSQHQLVPDPLNSKEDLHAPPPVTDTPAPPTSRQDEELPSPTSTEDVVTSSSSSVLGFSLICIYFCDICFKKLKTNVIKG
ncbi:Filamentous hemagglutinin [Dissostichus eleginoides]|uniref:Filamentous hemagglutinin n=1 Tax=Dissostichus eleginoides TaxID=100907 RepID=A0AAD9CBH5_DISEL|nr:Filamentous hemagglutinin [Dissostichus eleginoides]